MLDKKTWFCIYVIALVVSLFSLPRSFLYTLDGPLEAIIRFLLQFSFFYLPLVAVYVGINLLKSLKPNLGNYISSHILLKIGLYFLAEGIGWIIFLIYTLQTTWDWSLSYSFTDFSILVVLPGILLILIGIIKHSALKKALAGIGTGIFVLMIFVFISNSTPTGPPMESGTPIIESLKILGYDARDLNELKAHDGITMLKNSAGIQNNAKEKDERIVIYLRNLSIQPVTISKVRFGGTDYNFEESVKVIDNYEGTAPSQGNYVILTDGASGLLQSSSELQPDQTVTIVLDLADQFIIGRDAQFRYDTSIGNVFVGTITIGQEKNS